MSDAEEGRDNKRSGWSNGAVLLWGGVCLLLLVAVTLGLVVAVQRHTASSSRAKANARGYRLRGLTASLVTPSATVDATVRLYYSADAVADADQATLEEVRTAINGVLSDEDFSSKDNWSAVAAAIGEALQKDRSITGVEVQLFLPEDVGGTSMATAIYKEGCLGALFPLDDNVV